MPSQPNALRLEVEINNKINQMAYGIEAGA